MKDVYVITGATGGIGCEVAKNITKNGIVLISDLDEKKLLELQKKINKGNVKCEYIKCDVSNLKDVKALANKTRKLGKFKAMLHTAGVSGTMTNSEMIFKINLIGTKYLMDEFLKIADNSVFVNYASMAGHMVPDSKLFTNKLLNPLADDFWKKMKIFSRDPQAAYAFSKKGVILLTEYEVGKWAEKNSRILSISPGTIETPMLHQEAEATDAIKVMVEHAPVPRYGKPKEISKLSNFLISDEAAFITGIDVLIDGGITSVMKYNDILGRKKSNPKKWLSIFLYLFSFIGLPLITKASGLNPGDIYLFLLAINLGMVSLGTILGMKDDVDFSLLIIPLILYCIFDLILGFKVSLLNLVFLAIVIYLFQLLFVLFKEDKKVQK